jgi:hypothetical protein
MSNQFKQAVAWWLRAKDLQVKEVLDVKVNDSRGCSEYTGPYGSQDIVVTYLDDNGGQKKHWEEVDFAEFVTLLADTDWEGAAAELAAEKAAQKAERERIEQERREAAAKFQREIIVALFDGDTQVSDWVSFAVGKIALSDEWVKHHNFSQNTGPRLKLRTKDGASVSSANASVQEYVTKTYTIAWRTVW